MQSLGTVCYEVSLFTDPINVLCRLTPFPSFVKRWSWSARSGLLPWHSTLPQLLIVSSKFNNLSSAKKQK